MGKASTAWTIERLARRHDRSNFDCGQLVLNEWLQQRASQFERRDLARTFVAVRPGEAIVIGYHTLATHSVQYEILSEIQAKGLPTIDVPVVLLGRLAVDKTSQGQGLGAWLLLDALGRAERLAEEVGIRAVEVDAIDDTARSFYVKFGFASLTDDPHHLFLSMKEIRKLRLNDN